MTTNKNRVQAYVNDAVYLKIKEYAEANQYSVSTAVEKLLESLTGIVLSDLPSDSLTQVKDELTNEIIGKVEFYFDERLKLISDSLNELESKLPAIATIFQQELVKVYEQIAILKNQQAKIKVIADRQPEQLPVKTKPEAKQPIAPEIAHLKSKYLITDRHGESTYYWDSRNWKTDMTEAKIYISSRTAKNGLKRLRDRKNSTAGYRTCIEVVYDPKISESDRSRIIEVWSSKT